MTLLQSLEIVLATFFRSFVAYLPNFVGGLLVFILGLFLSQVVRRLIVTLSRFFRFKEIIKGISVGKNHDLKVWGDILIEIIGWAVVILFLIPASEVWGLKNVSELLRQILLYIPSVIVAVIVGFIGLLFSNLAYDMVRHGVKSIDASSAKSLAALAKYSIIFFTILVVLDQLRVAQDLIRILFTGIVVMISLAGGLAFGLGGKDIAKELLEKMRTKV